MAIFMDGIVRVARTCVKRLGVRQSTALRPGDDLLYSLCVVSVYGIALDGGTAMRQAMDTATKLQNLMRRLGVRSQTKFAKKLGFRNLSSIQRYFDVGRGNMPISQEMLQRMREKIEGEGCPPVTVSEILDLGGIALLTNEKQEHSVNGQNTLIITGDYIPVFSIVDVVTMQDGENEETHPISPPGYIFYNRPLKANERAIRLPDDSLAPTYPADAVAIVELGAEGSPGKPVLVRITQADGSQAGAIRLYNHQGHADDGSKIEVFKATAPYPDYRTLPHGVFPRVEAVGRVTRVIITIEC
jgi:hypothetical protein